MMIFTFLLLKKEFRKNECLFEFLLISQKNKNSNKTIYIFGIEILKYFKYKKNGCIIRLARK